MLLTGDEHLRVPRRDGEEGHGSSKLGDPSSNDSLANDSVDHLGSCWWFESSEESEDLLGFGEGGSIRWGREGEVDDRVDVHALHLKDDSLDGHSKDLGLSELLEVVLEDRRGVESVAVSGSCSSSSTSSLGGRSFGDPRDLEGLNST